MEEAASGVGVEATHCAEKYKLQDDCGRGGGVVGGVGGCGVRGWRVVMKGRKAL